MTHLRRATIVATSFLAARPLIKAALLEVATLSKLPNADAMQSGTLARWIANTALSASGVAFSSLRS